MRNICKRSSLVSIAVLLCSIYASLFLGSIVPVTASDISYTPIDETITVAENKTFVLPFKMRFNETANGTFATTFYWDNDETDPY